MKRPKLISATLCGLFAALTAALSQLSLPLSAVPINLALFAVFCAGAILGAKRGALSMLVWVLLGAAGVPVFALLRGGLAVLTGPTGGYIIGYIPAAFLTGLFIDIFCRGKKRLYVYPAAMLAGLFVCYTLGTAWYMYSTKTAAGAALLTCVVPFLFGDAMKIAAASAVSYKIRPIVELSVRG